MAFCSSLTRWAGSKLACSASKRGIDRRIGEFQTLGDSRAKVLVQVFARIDDCSAPENIHADFAILDRGKSAILVLGVQLGADADFVEHAADAPLRPP